MDIEEFYDADPRRRESEEIEFGREWSDANGARTELSWVADTGELYAMAEPSEPVFMDPIGDTRVPELPTELVTVEVLGTIPDRARVDELLAGWERQMGKPNSLQWVRDQLSAARLERGGEGAPGVGDRPLPSDANAKPSATSASYAWA